MRKSWIVGVLVLGIAWSVAAQTLEGVAAKVEEIKVEAQGVLDRNATLKPRSRLPGWVTDAMTRIVGVAESAALDIQAIIIRNREDPDNPTPGVTCDQTAASLSRADVQTAVDAATTGQTVCLPGDTETWTSPVSTDKDIKIIGAGKGTKAQCEVADQTTYTCITGTSLVFGWVTPLTGDPELGHMTFYADSCSDCSVYYSGFVEISGRNPNFRLHDIGIDIAAGAGPAYSGLMISRSVRGVGWNVTAVQRNLSSTHATIVMHQRWTDTTSDCSSTSGEGCGGRSWASASTLGTEDAWYWEDSTWEIADVSNVGHCTDDFIGARPVYRFNTLVNCQIQNHGTETGGRARGFRHVEYYRNNSSNSLEAANGMMNFRGGTGLAWGNVFTTSGSGSTTVAIQGTTYRRDDTSHNGGRWPIWNRCGVIDVASITRSGATATVTVSDSYDGVSTSGSWVTISGANQSEYNGTFWATGDGGDDTIFTYTVSGTPATPATGTIKSKSPFDGNNVADATGRRCLDGLGVGLSVMIAGDTSSMTIDGVGISSATLAESASEPVYAWSNTVNGSQNDLGGGSDAVAANRDVFNWNASYNGTSQLGIYVGDTLPTNCTIGDAAWIIDEGSWNTETSAIHANHGSNHSEGADGKLYIATATGAPCTTWTAKYGVNSTGEPYAYPHPLRTP
jgi:hypothetical protein